MIVYDVHRSNTEFCYASWSVLAVGGACYACRGLSSHRRIWDEVASGGIIFPKRSWCMTMSSTNNTNRKATFWKESLEKLKVNDLKSLLRKEGLPVSGRKSDLIDRLTNPLYRGPKPKAWQYSDAKKNLKRELLEPESPLHSMSAKEVQNTD